MIQIQKPKIIQADNGPEFKVDFSDWTKENKIDLIKTLTLSGRRYIALIRAFMRFQAS